MLMRKKKRAAPITSRSSNSIRKELQEMSPGFRTILAPDDRMLRQFAFLWIIFFGAIALAQEFHHHRHVLAMVLGVLAAVVGAFGIVWPRAIKPIFIAWMILVFPIGWIVSHVMLGILFYGMFCPVGLLFRITGRDGLELKPRQEGATYWQPKPHGKDKLQYLRQS
jgi:Saxitoxin biosynthesis operon protein SxtJ